MPRKPDIAVPVEDVAGAEETIERPLGQFVDHQRKAFVEVSKAFGALLPKELREHGQSAVREMLEGYRTLFNATLDDLIKTLEKARLETEEEEKRKGEDGVVDESRRN
jgi:hypothetical protein